jgi:hypothetical protein
MTDQVDIKELSQSFSGYVKNGVGISDARIIDQDGWRAKI